MMNQISEPEATKSATVLLTLGEELKSTVLSARREEIYALNRGMQKLSTIQENRQLRSSLILRAM